MPDRILNGLYGGVLTLMSKGYYDLAQQAQQTKQVSPELNYGITIFTAILGIDLLVNATRGKEPYTRKLFNYVAARLNSCSHSSFLRNSSSPQTLQK